MPSTSPVQVRTMNGIAHGWKPPADSKVAKIPIGVAKEFASADQTENKRAPVARALMGRR